MGARYRGTALPPWEAIEEDEKGTAAGRKEKGTPGVKKIEDRETIAVQEMQR